MRSLSSSQINDSPVKMYSVWNKAVTSTIDGVMRTEVPIGYSRRRVSLFNIPGDSVGEKPDVSMLSTVFDRLVIIHEEAGYRAKIIRFHPDKSYLRRHGFDASHNYLHAL
ncbi:hypothetical protein, partial [Sinomicrobium soli]|uniref:hypothetical protein n=1 Tax=Sinomicrobium sp. N-1-3-6 TaxID=2219864 RepID=UPI0011BD8A6E